MTISLYARITPKTTANIASFDCKLRDKIAEYFGAENTYEGSVVTIYDYQLPYLYGLRAASTDQYDSQYLDAIIDVLESGATVDIWKSS